MFWAVPTVGWTAAIVMALAAISIVDLRSRRVPNACVLALLILGLGLGLREGGLSGLSTRLQSIGVGAGMLLVPYLFGYIGAGDVKAAGAIGAVMGGPAATLRAMFLGTLIGGVMSAALLLLRLRRGPPPPATVPLGAALCGGAALAALGLP